MKPCVCITIDTEEDNWGDYNQRRGAVENIEQLPVLQALFDRYEAIPTYLINYPVATQASSIRILDVILQQQRCEIGTHCHPWNTPPLSEEPSARNSMMCNLDYELLLAKLTQLHQAIETAFSMSPVSFRAGRWAFNEDVAKCLAQLGYQVDTSMSPFVDWRPYHGPDFSNSPTKPFRFHVSNIHKAAADGELLQIPPTIGYFQKNFAFCHRLENAIRHSALGKLRLLGILDKLQWLNFRWLSPELSSGKDMVRLAKRFVANGHGILNMSFHSTTLLPGKSPFVKTAEDRERFLGEIEVFLHYAREEGLEFIPLRETVQRHAPDCNNDH